MKTERSVQVKSKGVALRIGQVHRGGELVPEYVVHNFILGRSEPTDYYWGFYTLNKKEAIENYEARRKQLLNA